jgi:hypothetical protein
MSKGQTLSVAAFSNVVGGPNQQAGSAAVPAIAQLPMRGYLPARQTVDSA